MRLGSLAALAACAGLAACVTGRYRHVSRDEPLDRDALAALEPGRATLATCLAALGAPHRVSEHRPAADGSAGMVLLWVWQDAAGWGLQLSSSYEDAPLSVEYDATDRELPAVALWLGPDLVLERVRTGTVGELEPRARPRAVDG
jgi:hypothetical protein